MFVNKFFPFIQNDFTKIFQIEENPKVPTKQNLSPEKA